MSAVTRRTAADLAGAIRRRELSSVEVVAAHLAHIDGVDGDIGAIATLDTAGAMAQALQADAALARGDCRGPLHGVPITVKDAFGVAGLRTTLGHPSVDYVADADVTPVARLRAAGAVILGKTNVPPFLLDFQTDNELFGRTRNPWDLDRTPGGSTGGGCAAVAAGMTPLELGGDFAGSLRVPAHYCGVCTIKPTEFLLSAGRGPAPRAIRHMAQVGPVARSVEDLVVALRVLAGADRGVREVPPIPLAEAPRRALSSYRVAWMSGLPGATPSRAIRSSMSRLADGLADLGCPVRERVPDGWEAIPLFETWAELGYAELASGMDDDARRALCDDLRAAPDASEPGLRGIWRGVHADARSLGQTLQRRDAYADALDDLLDTADVLLMPTAMTTAIPHWPTAQPLPVDDRREPYWLTGLAHTAPTNLTGHPSVTCPVGRADDGLPIGVQVVGRRWQDLALLGFAAALARFVGPLAHPPAFTDDTGGVRP